MTWSSCRGSPAHAFDSWLVSHGWDRTAEWKWTHLDSGYCLDLSSVGDIGQRQHVVRDAWRAWCLRRHMVSERRDVQLDCFHDAAGYIYVVLTGMLLVRLSLPVRKLGLWLVVPLFACSPWWSDASFFLPCACGIVAVSLAHLNISLGIVLAACVMSLILLSFVVSIWLGCH